VKRRVSGFRTVLFDCDSTLVTVEGVDELAARAGTDLSELTRAAMEGRLPLERVYGRRLDAIRPDRAALEWLGERYAQTLVEGTREVVAALAALDVAVHVISGGLEPAVRSLGGALGIAPHRVHAVGVRFTDEGNYSGYDENSPLARAGGKAEVGRVLVDQTGRPSAVVGDGVTDLELRGVCDLFVGFGGVARRERVASESDVFIDRPDFFPVLRALASESQLEWLMRSGHRETVARARS
jgi:phosphoserine phosphatase